MTTCTEEQTRMAEEILARISSDLSMITDREFKIEDPQTELAEKRSAGRNKIHISFKLGFQEKGGEVKHGCILVPLPDAISLACYLMMVPDEGVLGKRAESKLDESTKDAMVEVANFIGGAADAAMREALGLTVKVRSEGCQGVRPDVRPALVYTEGDPLVISTAHASVHEYPTFDLVAIIPPMGE